MHMSGVYLTTICNHVNVPMRIGHAKKKNTRIIIVTRGRVEYSDFGTDEFESNRKKTIIQVRR